MQSIMKLKIATSTSRENMIGEVTADEIQNLFYNPDLGGVWDERVKELEIPVGLKQRRRPLKYSLPAHGLDSLRWATTADDFQQQHHEAVDVALCGQLVSVYKFWSEVSYRFRPSLSSRASLPTVQTPIRCASNTSALLARMFLWTTCGFTLSYRSLRVAESKQVASVSRAKASFCSSSSSY